MVFVAVGSDGQHGVALGEQLAARRRQEAELLLAAAGERVVT